MLVALKNLSDVTLLDGVKELKQVEDKTLAELVLYLSEVDKRKLYREIGFSSMFSYLTSSLDKGGLGYSEGSAYRRIQAARVLKENPEIYELLRTGKMSLYAVTEVSKVIKPENKAELLELTQGQPKEEIQKITLKYQEASKVRGRERVSIKKVLVQKAEPIFSASRLQSQQEVLEEEARFTISVEVDQEFMDLMTEAKHIIGIAPKSEILKRTLKEFVNKRKAAPRVLKKVESKRPTHQTRYIPKAIAYKVRERDQHQCCFISPDGNRCSEKCGLQFDHIKPFALGGSNDASNLRLLCSAHNLLLAEKAFGRNKIESNFRRGGESHSK